MGKGWWMDVMDVGKLPLKRGSAIYTNGILAGKRAYLFIV